GHSNHFQKLEAMGLHPRISKLLEHRSCEEPLLKNAVPGGVQPRTITRTLVQRGHLPNTVCLPHVCAMRRTIVQPISSFSPSWNRSTPPTQMTSLISHHILHHRVVLSAISA